MRRDDHDRGGKWGRCSGSTSWAGSPISVGHEATRRRRIRLPPSPQSSEPVRTCSVRVPSRLPDDSGRSTLQRIANGGDSTKRTRGPRPMAGARKRSGHEQWSTDGIRGTRSEIRTREGQCDWRHSEREDVADYGYYGRPTTRDRRVEESVAGSVRRKPMGPSAGHIRADLFGVSPEDRTGRPRQARESIARRSRSRIDWVAVRSVA